MGVIDDKGKLVDEISVRDLRGMGFEANSFWRLYGSIGQFKKSVRERYASVGLALVVNGDDSFATVITKMHESKMHTAWVVDKKGHPVHKISQRDVLVNCLPFMHHDVQPEA